MERGTREYVFWSIAIVLVLAFALIPVLWLISVSLKPPRSKDTLLPDPDAGWSLRTSTRL